MSENRNKGFGMSLNLIAVIAIFTVAGAGNLVNAGIQTMIEAWPDVAATSIRTVSTLPALTSLPVMLLISVVVGKQIGYQTVSIIGCVLVVVGGLGPVFYAPSWNVVLVFRAIIGIGAGMFGMRTALLMESLPQEQYTKYVGIATAFYCIPSLLAGPVPGAGYGLPCIPFSAAYLLLPQTIRSALPLWREWRFRPTASATWHLPFWGRSRKNSRAIPHCWATCCV